MANKFTQSVLQQLEQQQKPKTEGAGKKEPKQTEKKPLHKAEKKVQDATETMAAQPPPETSSAFRIPDLSEFLRPEPARVAKNKTFYLDTEVIDALHKTAKQQHVTDSKLANDILRRVLGIN